MKTYISAAEFQRRLRQRRAYWRTAAERGINTVSIDATSTLGYSFRYSLNVGDVRISPAGEMVCTNIRDTSAEYPFQVKFVDPIPEPPYRFGVDGFAREWPRFPRNE